VKIGVQDSDLVPIHRQRYRDIGGHSALSHAPLAGEYHNLVSYPAHAVGKGFLLLFFLGLLVLREGLQTVGRLIFLFTHFFYSSLRLLIFSGSVSGVEPFPMASLHAYQFFVHKFLYVFDCFIPVELQTGGYVIYGTGAQS